MISKRTQPVSEFEVDQVFNPRFATPGAFNPHLLLNQEYNPLFASSVWVWVWPGTSMINLAYKYEWSGPSMSNIVQVWVSHWCSCDATQIPVEAKSSLVRGWCTQDPEGSASPSKTMPPRGVEDDASLREVQLLNSSSISSLVKLE